MPIARLSSSLINALECPEGRAHLEVFDTLIPGLYVDIQPSGRISFRLRYRVGIDKRYLTLGNARVLTVQEAREKARDALRRMTMGNDPKMAAVAVLNLTIEQFFMSHYLPYARTYKRSWACDLSLIRRHLLPTLGDRAMGDLTTQDAARLVSGMQTSGYAKGTINRVLVLLRYGYVLAMRWELPSVVSNPLKELRNLRNDNKIERFLTTEKAGALFAAVEASENPLLRFIVPFLMFTGARKREVLDARWQDIDLERRTWRIPRTKADKVRHVPLSRQALELLQALQSLRDVQGWDAQWLFPNPRTGQPFRSVYYSWHRARCAAGLPDFRVHDLRHSFASFLVNAGRSLYEVQELLGHADMRTTTRYAHLSRDRLFEAVESIPDVG